jgi:hypothetical protein
MVATGRPIGFWLEGRQHSDSEELQQKQASADTIMKYLHMKIITFTITQKAPERM